MMTIGLIEVGNERTDCMPNAVHGSKLVKLVQKNRRQLERAISNPKLDAVAIFGLSPSKNLLAEKALMEKKSVFVDFPVAETFEKTIKLDRTATKEGQRIYSPNLLRTEPGFQELKRKIQDPTSKLLSLTITCAVKAKSECSEFRMKVVQILDALEWLDLSLYLVKSYDCLKSQFKFSGFPAYPCPVEIKKRFSGFNCQILPKKCLRK